MGKTPMDYKNGKIYIIRSKCGPEYYIGSTAYLTLAQRFTKHKTNFKCGKLKETSKILFEKYGVENCCIELLEEYPCSSKTELEAREGYHQREHWEDENLVNRYLAGRTVKEWFDDNKEYIKNYKSNYYETNKSELYLKYKNHYEQNKSKIREYQGEKVICECGLNSTRTHLSRHKTTKRHNEELNKKLFDELPLK
jgi:hypothetical protein